MCSSCRIQADVDRFCADPASLDGVNTLYSPPLNSALRTQPKDVSITVSMDAGSMSDLGRISDESGSHSHDWRALALIEHVFLCVHADDQQKTSFGDNTWMPLTLGPITVTPGNVPLSKALLTQPVELTGESVVCTTAQRASEGGRQA